jgi:hypothetical protein
VFAEHEIAEGDLFETRMTRIGLKATPTTGTEIDTAFSDAMTEYGPRSFATLGMRQGWSIGERWTLDVGGEQAKTLNAPADINFDARVPPASGGLSGDFMSGFVGTAFRAPDWSFTSRLEYRDSETDRQRMLIGGFYRERVAGHGFSSELRLLERVTGPGLDSFDGKLRVGWAYRPADSRWMLFERADWISERRAAADATTRSLRFVNNFNGHFRANSRNELGVQYALKVVRSDFSGFRARGVVDLLGLDWRRQIKPKVDFGMHASWYRAPDVGITESGWGIDFGINVATNLIVSAGYNFDGFTDDDFARARYTAQGPFVEFKLKVDQASLQDLLRR